MPEPSGLTDAERGATEDLKDDLAGADAEPDGCCLASKHGSAIRTLLGVVERAEPWLLLASVVERLAAQAQAGAVNIARNRDGDWWVAEIEPDGGTYRYGEGRTWQAAVAVLANAMAAEEAGTR
jgi:hypothetical protein